MRRLAERAFSRSNAARSANLCTGARSGDYGRLPPLLATATPLPPPPRPVWARCLTRVFLLPAVHLQAKSKERELRAQLVKMFSDKCEL